MVTEFILCVTSKGIDSTLLGVILTFIVGFAGLIIGIAGLRIGIINSRKTNFINSVTASRVKYIQDIRNSISEFCGLVHSYMLTYSTSHSLAATPEKLFEIQKELDKLKYRIKLYLNPEDKYWDEKILALIDEIIIAVDKTPKKKIDALIAITQFLLKFEWEGAKRESKDGILSEEERGKLYREHVALYEKYITENPNLKI